MSHLEEGKYPRREIIYYTNAGTVPRAITITNISILEAFPDDEYVPIIKSVSFILENLKNTNQQALIKLYDMYFLSGSSNEDSHFETKTKRVPKFTNVGNPDQKKNIPNNSSISSKDNSNNSSSNRESPAPPSNSTLHWNKSEI